MARERREAATVHFRTAGIATAFLALALPATGRADETANEAEFRFQRAAEFYAKGKYDEALSEFFSSNRLVPNRNVAFNIARCYERLGRFNEAYRYYNDLLGEAIPAADRAAIKEALTRLRPNVALVHIESDPPGADIFVDRKDLGLRGTAPRTLALPPGRTTVILELSGYRAATKQTTLARGAEAKVQLTLVRIYGTIEVRGTPGAEIRLDRADAPPLCTVPCLAKALPGRHVVHATLAGHVSGRLDADVPPDATVKVIAALEALPAPKGAVVVTANRTGALVKIDGREAGFTPTVAEVEEGEHQVDVAYEDFETWTGKVVVRAEGKAFVNVVLQVAQPRVVAAAKTSMRAEDAPASVTVITSEELRALGYATLADVLRGVRGFYNTYDHVYEYIGVRGFSPPGDYSNRVLVMLDGHPFVELWSGANYVGHDFDVDLSMVDHIEVVRGPGSALYGTGAFFSVVNVVPKARALGLHGEGLAGAGSLTSAWARVAGSWEGETFGAVATGAVHRSRGEESVFFDDGAMRVSGRDGEGADHVYGRLRAGPFTLFGVYQSRTKRIPAPGPEGGSPVEAGGPASTDARHFVELRFDKALGAVFQVAARAYLDVSRFDSTVPYDPPEADYSEAGGATWFGGEVRASVGPFAGLRFTLGAEAQWQQVYQQSRQGDEVPMPYASYPETVISGYALAEWKPLEGLSLTPGLRFDYYGQSFGLAVNPRAGLVARPYDGGVTKVIVGTAFRAPTVLERYYNDQGVSTSVQLPACVLGAPCTLQPERIVTAEVEHSHRITDALTAGAAVYGSQISELIAMTTVPGPNTPADDRIQYKNAEGMVRAFGAEVELRYRPERLFMASGSYSFQFARNEDWSRIANSPQHAVVGKLMVPLASTALMAGIQLAYLSPRLSMERAEIGEVLHVAATLSGEVPKWHLRYQVSAGNLLNESYLNPGGNEIYRDAVPQRGRVFRAEVGAFF